MKTFVYELKTNVYKPFTLVNILFSTRIFLSKQVFTGSKQVFNLYILVYYR